MRTMQILRTCLLVILLTVLPNGCSSDDDLSAVEVRVNGTALVENDDDFFGDINGDFTGTGGSTTRTFNWENNSSTAEYNADITTIASGSFRMVVKDTRGSTVLNRTLSGSGNPDSFSGVTTEGSSGVWSVTITLTDFNGNGSFSISQGT